MAVNSYHPPPDRAASLPGLSLAGPESPPAARRCAARLRHPGEVGPPRVLGAAHAAPVEALGEQLLRPAAGAGHRRAVSLLPCEQVEHGAAEQERVAARGWELRRRPLPEAAGHGRAHVAR